MRGVGRNIRLRRFNLRSVSPRTHSGARVLNSIWAVLKSAGTPNTTRTAPNRARGSNISGCVHPDSRYGLLRYLNSFSPCSHAENRSSSNRNSRVNRPVTSSVSQVRNLAKLSHFLLIGLRPYVYRGPLFRPLHRHFSKVVTSLRPNTCVKPQTPL